MQPIQAYFHDISVTKTVHSIADRLSIMKMKTDYQALTNHDIFGLREGREPAGHGLVDAISLTAEVCGQSLSSAAAEILAEDLGDFSETAVLAALARCRMELQGPLKVADILARIDDGRPEAEEAWAMMPESELASVVWTDEMALAWGIALPLLNIGDYGGARAAFRESYTTAVLRARVLRKPVHWMPSLGSDVAARERVLLDAVRKGRLSAAHAEQLLPRGSASDEAAEIIAQVKIKNLH